MTEEELRREREEARQLTNQINSLISQINSLNQENQYLERELVQGINNVYQLIDSASKMDKAVNKDMEYLRDTVSEADINTSALFRALKEFSSAYFIFKNIGEASKNITQYNEHYYTKFSYYNELRRITLGYVIGLDSHICSSETMRKKVEKVYLQNTDYWLAYCIAATMLWANDEKEAAERAIRKSMSINYNSSCLFYMLINLRFSRVDAAREWYLSYLNRMDVNNLGDEWQYLLQAYLQGGFGSDLAFHQHVSKFFRATLDNIRNIKGDYGQKISKKATELAESYIHKTNKEFVTLKETCADYDELIKLLSEAEKNALMAKKFNDVAETETRVAEELPQRIEDVLYSLISNYDQQELEVVNKIRYNEAIIQAKGDLSAAQAFFSANFGEIQGVRSLDKLLLNWAFADKKSNTDISVKRFSISVLREQILQGLQNFVAKYRESEQEKYALNIDGCILLASENEYETDKSKLEKYYKDTKLRDILNDKYVIAYSAACGVSLLVLGIMAFSFSEVVLVIAVLIAIAGSFLLWRRIVEMDKILLEKKRLGIDRLKNSLNELKSWRGSFREEDARCSDFEVALGKFTSLFSN